VFVAAFIGSPSMNLYDGKFTVGEHGGTVTLGSQTLAFGPALLDKRPALRGYDGKRLIVGIRPEDFEDAAITPEVPADRRLRAPVSLIEALGSELMVHFSVDASTVDSGDPDAPEQPGEGQANAVGRFSPRSQIRPRDTIEIAVTTENLHFFDADSRLSIWS
jgi:multiple sugar transport system ATP-binding protein